MGVIIDVGGSRAVTLGMPVGSSSISEYIIAIIDKIPLNDLVSYF